MQTVASNPKDPHFESQPLFVSLNVSYLMWWKWMFTNYLHQNQKGEWVSVTIVGCGLESCSWCYKTLFGGNLDFPKVKKLNKVCSNVWTCSKMWKQCYFKQNNALELFISLKMAISCCFGLRGSLDFPDFLQIKFYNINYWHWISKG